MRRMRDSNWLGGTLSDCGGGQFCYADWLTNTYNINPPGGSAEYRLNFAPGSAGNKWTLEQAPGSPGASYFRFFRQNTGALNHDAAGEQTLLYGKVKISVASTAAPYNSTSPLMVVRSTVWWTGKNCPSITNLINPTDTNCKIVLEENFTNWKNY